MAYIKLEDLQKFPIRIDHCDKEHGNVHFVYGIESVLEYADHLLKYDIDAKSKWISADDQMPEDIFGTDRERISVLVCTKSGKVSECTRCAEYKFDKTRLTYYRSGGFRWSKNKLVTHWMPLPEPPSMTGGALI